MSELPPYRSLFLLIGAGAGLVIAAVTILAPAKHLPQGAVATVNEVGIDRDALARMTATGIDPKTALEILIDQEILVQRGLELGLASNDPSVREAIIAALTTQIQAQTLATPPNEQVLQDYYAAHQDRYREAERVEAADLIARDVRKAEAAEADLRRSMPIAEVAKRHGLVFGPLAFDALVPRGRADAILGPELASWLDKLESGTPSPPVRLEDGFHIIIVLARQSAQAPEFNKARERVAADVIAETLARAQADYLAYLRRRARIVAAP